MRRLASIVPLVVLAACQQTASKGAEVDHAWVRLPAVVGRPGAGYFMLHAGPVDDRLMSVSSPQAIRAEMHDMSMKDGIMKMAAIDGGLAVPARGTVTFDSGGKHVMLFDISPNVKPGGTMTLRFSMVSGGMLEAQAKVIAAGDEEPNAQ